MKNVWILVLILALVGCFHEWPDTPESYYHVIEGPLQDSGIIDAAGYQNCINIRNELVIIESPDVPINGVNTLGIDNNGYNWVWLDASGLSPGDTFSVSINGDILNYEVN